MESRHYLNIFFIFAATACSGTVEAPEWTVGEDNAVVLHAGIGTDSGRAVQTKADDGHNAGADGGGHVRFETTGTEATLRAEGIWTGHEPDGIVKTTTATIGGETLAGSGHNELGMSPTLYWDDYGTADPDNVESGRKQGISIYGAAVDGVKKAPEVSDWKALLWRLESDQKNGWEKKDLLTSNNISSPNSLKFDSRNSENNLLVFTHAMSKVTVNLKAGEGFAGGKFERTPEVTVLDTHLEGLVNIIEGSTKTSGNDAASTISLKKESTATESFTATFTGLVVPGNKYLDTDNILKIKADGNIFYVTAEKINAANIEAEKKFERGKNYVFRIIVNKTGIVVTATISDWTQVHAEEIAPVINVKDNWGNEESGSNSEFTSFSFYRSSTDKFKDYSKDGVAYKPAEEGGQWHFKTAADGEIVKLFWPDHSTHYHFRGVWPLTGTPDGSPDVTSAEDHSQKIDLENVAYTANSYPSDLLVGMPEFTDGDKDCNNSDHKSVDQSEKGICATSGKINLNFRYVMSQIEVVLKTTPEGDRDHVEIGANTKVEIINVANDGYVRLGDRQIIAGRQDKEYTIDPVDGDGNQLKRHSAIVPQSLDNVRFRITVTNADATNDIYYADVKPIRKADGKSLVAPDGRWESGVHYVYTLFLKKTELKLSASISKWTTVEADEPVWM